MRTSAVPTKAVTVYNSALALSNRGDYNTALDEYNKAIQIFPDFIEAYNNIGEIYSRMGDSSQAISIYRKALDIERNHKLLLNLGVEYYNSRDYETALEYFKESLKKKRDFLEGNFYSGMAFFNLKNLKKAEKFFVKVIKIDKRHLKANYLLSYIYYEWKDYDRAIVCLDNIRDIADDKVFLNKYYGFCYYHLGKYEEAVEYLKVALEESPQYAKFRDYLDNLTYENKKKEIGDVDKRITEIEKKMMNQKPSLQEYTHLGMLYIFKGEYKKAEHLLKSAKKKNNFRQAETQNQ